MGFSLAQMSLSFIIPAHAVDVYARVAAPLAFLATFTIVASTWYAHHWLFDHLFVPKASTIFVNFAMLASMIWLVYQLQVYVHFAPTNQSQFATMSYLLTLAVTWLLLGLLYGMCLRLRWDDLSGDDRRLAMFKTGRIATIGLTAGVSTLVLWALHQRVETAFFVMLAAGAVWRVAARRVPGMSAA